MEIKQKTYLRIEKGSRNIDIVLDADMPLGLLFDALMEAKSYVVDRMLKAQKEEEAQAEVEMGAKEEAPKVVENKKE